MPNSNERYIGDGVYASLDPARMIILRTTRYNPRDPLDREGGEHWIALEPEVLCSLIEFAYEIGWGDVIKAAKPVVSDEAYARDEEDAERVRASKEGFPDEDA